MDKEIVIKPIFVFKDYFKVYLYLFFNRLAIKILLTTNTLIILFNVYLLFSGQILLSEIFSFSFAIIFFFSNINGICSLQIY
jgi:hypothetical protein